MGQSHAAQKGFPEPAGVTSAPTPQASGSRGVPAGPDVAGPDVAAGELALHCPTLRPEGARPQPFPAPRPPGAARGAARGPPWSRG